MKNQKILDAALDLAKSGIPIFPCRPDKSPYTPNGFKSASTDKGMIERWWKQWPDALIGMPTGEPSGLDVLDIDAPKGEKSISDLQNRYGKLFKTPTVKTGSGGRHYYFRHVPGVRNSQSKIAPGIDVRGEGGYVIVPPSVSVHGDYAWLVDLAGHAAADWPTWLLNRMQGTSPAAVLPMPDTATHHQTHSSSALNRCRAYVAKMPPAISGHGGHNATFEVACTCFRFDLEEQDALSVLNEFNQRCTPPWSEKELKHKLTEAGKEARRAGEVGKLLNGDSGMSGAVATKNNPEITGSNSTSSDGAEVANPAVARSFVGLSEIIADDTLRHQEPIIDGRLRRAEVGVIVAAAKAGKSWLIGHLICAAITGGKWLGHDVAKCRVGLVDCELTLPTIRGRLAKIGELYGLCNPEDFKDCRVMSLRRNPATLPELLKIITGHKGEFDLVIADPLYKLWPKEFDENSNVDTGKAFADLISTAEIAGCAILAVHHSTKGSQAAKDVIDVGSGGGSIGRACDSQIILRAHSEAGIYVVDGITRTFPPTAPTCWQIEPPSIRPRLDLNPGDLKGTRIRREASGGKQHKSDDNPAYMAVVAHAGPEPKPLGWFAAKACEGKDHAARSLLRQAVAVGVLHHWPAKKARDFERWATVPQGPS